MQTVEQVLKSSTIEGFVVKLPAVQLDRKLYSDTAKKLELIGGKWNRKHQGFLFQSDPSELMESICNGDTRNIKKEYQFFATPPEIADWLVSLAPIKSDSIILEPSTCQPKLNYLPEKRQRAGTSGAMKLKTI